MAESPDMTLISDVKDVEKTYGKNLYTFYDSNETGLKCAVEILTTDLSTRLALVEQYPNQVGYFHFDIQKILQNYTTPNYSAETPTTFSYAPDETFRYSLRYGYVNVSGTFIVQGTIENKIIIGGRKEYDELDFNYELYTPEIASSLGCSLVLSKGSVLSDMSTSVPKNELTGVVPDWITTDSSITNISVLKRHRLDTDFVVSWLNNVRPNLFSPPPTDCDGIRGVRITIVLINGTIPYDNIVPVLFDSGTPVYPQDIVHYNFGNRNNTFSLYQDIISHIYIAPYTLKGGAECGSTSDDYGLSPMYNPIRLDVVNQECNDFEYVQVSWLNSFGVRDYFYFTKRTDNNYNISRDTYVSIPGTWSEQTFSIPSYSRGEQVYNTIVDENWTITTDFLSDDDAFKLSSLFISPDVRVRFSPSSTWIPVVITNNTWTERTFRKDKFFQYQLQLKMANKKNIQRG